MGKFFKSTLFQKEVHLRSKYVDHSQRFVDWVNGLGIERTIVGKVAHYLEMRFQVRRFSLVFLYCLVLAFLIVAKFDFSYSGYELGDRAASQIRAPVNFEVTDESLTLSKRSAAEHQVPGVFKLSNANYEALIGRIYAAFQMMRDKLKASQWPSIPSQRDEFIKDFFKFHGDFEAALGNVPVPPRVYEWLVSKQFNAKIENIITREIENISNLRIVADSTLLKDEPLAQVELALGEEKSGGEELSIQKTKILDLYGARQKVLQDIRSAPLGLSPEDKALVSKFIQTLLIPNVDLNREETLARRQKARDAVMPVRLSVKKNQVIVEEGQVIDGLQLQMLEEVRKRTTGQNRDFEALMIAGFLVSLVLVFFSYLRRFTLNRVQISNKDLWAMGTITLVSVTLSKILIFFIDEALVAHFGVFVPKSAFLFAIPAASAPILVGLLISAGEVVWLYTVFHAVVLSFLLDFNFMFLAVTIISGIAGARGVFKCKRRNDIYMAGIRTGLVTALVISLLTLATQGYSSDVYQTLIWNASAGFFSGCLSSLVAMMLVPLLETIFNYTTDVKLLELGNLDHPLLKDMIVRAPGTYHHSLVVGSMVEAAAEEIGANPLLAKVSSYYHDIGKTEHSNYFIENQRPGHNPHDHLSPNMSKTILIAHVKDGVELATKYKLGKPLIDVIVQHHGTTLISFFFNRAVEKSDESLPEVSEEDFRYPGPKPQFREAALCMLADSIEAAARSLDEPTPVRLQNIVKNIIQRKFMDGQLDECNLTLRDLSVIEQAFIRILLGIYHQRIDYPRAAGGGASEQPQVL